MHRDWVLLPLFHVWKSKLVLYTFLGMLAICQGNRDLGELHQASRKIVKNYQVEGTWPIVFCSLVLFFFHVKLLNQNRFDTLLCSLTGQCHVYCYEVKLQSIRLHILRELRAFPWYISSQHFYLNIIDVGGEFDIVSVAEGFYPSCLQPCAQFMLRCSEAIYQSYANVVGESACISYYETDHQF